MHMANDKGAPHLNTTKPLDIIEEVRTGEMTFRPKFPISMEKKIEHLWLQAKDRGWEFSDFIIVVMEVLTVLHHRNVLPNGETVSHDTAHNNGV